MALEDTKPDNSKSIQISEAYIQSDNSPTYDFKWDGYKKLPVKVHPADNGQCKKYAEALSGIYAKGDAIVWKKYINSYEPSLGAVVVFDYGHIAVVIEINYMTKEIVISERNYKGKWIVSQRTLDFTDSSISGYVEKKDI